MTTRDQYPSRAMAVANWFLDRSWKEPEKPHCDQMKLYKLTFYAHGWYLANCSAALYPEDVEAWPHGPVVRSLYSEFNEFGRSPVTKLGKHLEIGEDGAPSFLVPEHNGPLDGFFEKVWNVYGDKTGIQLSNMTHRHGEPWTVVAEQYHYDLTGKPIISNEIIEACFANKLKSASR